MEKGLLSYSPKVLLALQFSIGGNIKFFQWLTEAGYPELAAFSNFLQDDIEAEQWLVQTVAEKQLPPRQHHVCPGLQKRRQSYFVA